MNNKSIFEENWNVIRKVIEKNKGQVYGIYDSSPCNSSEILKAEQELNFSIPNSLKTMFSTIGEFFEVEFSYTDDDQNSPFPEIFGGRMGWGIDTLFEHKELWSQAQNSSDEFWCKPKNLFPFYSNNRGGLTAIQIEGDNLGAIYFLGQAIDDDAHNYLLANNFIEFINSLTLLGMPHWEGDCFLRFTTSPTSGLVPYGDNGETISAWTSRS